MRLPKLLVLIICYLFRRRRGGRVAMSFSEIRMLRPAQPKPLSHQVTFLVRNFRFLWHRRRWHNHVITLVRVFITGRAAGCRKSALGGMLARVWILPGSPSSLECVFGGGRAREKHRQRYHYNTAFSFVAHPPLKKQSIIIENRPPTEEEDKLSLI